MDDQPPEFAEFYLRLDDGRVTRGRTRLMYVWNVADWHLLRNCHALDIEEWCVSMVFETFIEQYGTFEQKRKLRMLLSEVILEL